MGALIQDLRYALRTLARGPGYALTAVATLALGIGANTPIYSVIQAVLLAPLPYPEPGRLVALEHNISAPELADLRATTRSFAAMGGASPMTYDLTGAGEPQKLSAAIVAGQLFGAPEAIKPLLNNEKYLLENQNKSAADATIIIRAHQNTKTGAVQAAIRACQEAGFEKFTLRAKEDQGAG